ncbi:hypothetical protein [Deinococcus pimensis]|uniref:hypothetical protein n=1 Tax=Deinococcus pimensis TaxID=309888 RepID=UPI0004BAF758|nr:hypothetical protein [Deinococcus pimensis]
MTALPASHDVWRARALRYTLIYLLLALVLVGLRFGARDIRPELLDLREERTILTRDKQALELDVQAATSTARVREWALANGMTPFSRASKATAAFEVLPAPPAPPAARSLEVTTVWK